MNELGKQLITAINKKFHVNIQVTDENADEMSNLVSNIVDALDILL